MPAERRRPSPHSMHRARAQRQARAPSLLPLTFQGRLRDSLGTPTMPGTASCALPTGPLPSSTIRTRAVVQHPVETSGTARVRVLSPSTHLGRSWDLTPTISVDVTATCVLLAVRSPRSMLRTRAQDLFPRGHSPQTSLQWALTQEARSSDSTLTRAQYSTASCALLTASSPNSLPLARYSPTPTPSTLWARSRDSTLTQTSWVTAFCALPTAPSPRSMPRAPTIPVDNNDPGAIVGEAIDGGTVIHGFLATGF